MKKNYPFPLPFLVCITIVAILTFSCKKDHPASIPILTTSAITNITDSAASSGGKITSDGGSPVQGRGVTWDTSAAFLHPAETNDGTGTGSFSSSITGLVPGTTYYVRAYAVNAVGTGYGDVVKFTTGYVPSKYTVTTIAGSGAAGRVDGNGVSASFSSPDGVCVDPSGNIIVADGANMIIRKITPGGTVTTLALTDGFPYDVAADASGNIYISESSLKILKLTPAGTISVFAGSGTKANVDGTGTAASFYEPFTLATDGYGNLYVGDHLSIRKITPSGVVSTLPNNLSVNTAVATDKFNNLYISDGFVIKMVDTLGVPHFIAGGQGSADGFGATAGFNQIVELKVDQAGNIYAADISNNKIRMITPAGFVTTFAGTGLQGAADGNAAIATFNGPSGLAIDAVGTIYVADFGNNKIRKISQ
jgi:sugar lactone lactonase YvrE